MSTLFYPPSVDWEVTSACNHNCIHCYNYWRKQENARPVEHDKWYYIECAKKLIEAKPVSVQITGGEPLLVWPKIENAIVMLLDAGINVSINTNATLVTDHIARFLSEKHIDAFISFPCSRSEVFDMIANKKGAAKCAEAGIQKLLNHKVRISLNMVVTKLNFPYVYETACYAYDTFHISYFSATKASFPLNAEESFRHQVLSREEFNEMLDIMLRVKNEKGIRVDSAWVYSLCGFDNKCIRDAFGFNRKCACGRYNFVLNASGGIKACGCDKNEYGNIFKDTFAEAISRMHKWQDGSLLPPECKMCSALKYCGGGCRADGQSTFGNDCSLDSTANPEHHFEQVLEKGELNYDDNICVELNDGVKFVQENKCVRVSHKTNYEFISQLFAEFMTCNKSFNVKMLKTACGQEDSIVHHCVVKLISKGILKRIDDISIPQCVKDGVFSLMTSPYVPSEASQLIIDYAGSDYNFKRFY